jgi:hypothetical protein
MTRRVTLSPAWRALAERRRQQRITCLQVGLDAERARALQLDQALAALTSKHESAIATSSLLRRQPLILGIDFDFPIADWDRSKSTAAVGKLADYATELSENDCCASWLTEQAFYLWSGTVIGVTAEEVLELQHLHDEAGGWLHWFQPGTPGRFTGGLTFLPTAEWLPIFEEWSKAGSGREAVLRG